MKAVGIIPARWHPTRLPAKPLHLIANNPRLRHVSERCRRAKKLDAIIIATDDMRIAKAAFAWGAEVAMTSPTHQSGTDRIAEVARKARQFGLVINIQGDEPLTEPALLDRFVETLRSVRTIDIVTAAPPFENAAEASSPHHVTVIVTLAGNAVYFSRSALPFTRKGTAPVV